MAPATLPRLRIPAVSTRISRSPSTSTSVSTGSRVVPARSLTITRAEPMRRGDGQRLPQSERVELCRQRFVLGTVDLVRGHHHGAGGPAQQVGELGIARSDSGAGV